MDEDRLTPLEPSLAARAGLSPEQYYEQVTHAHARKRRGQYFTPAAIALQMTRWAMANRSCGVFVDPAAGAGIFIRQALLQPGAHGWRFTGYDIDAEVLALAREALPVAALEQVGLLHQDFLMQDALPGCDAIVCNPPYLKHHAIPDKTAVFARMRRLGFHLPETTNYYCLFLLRASQLLRPGGRCAFIVPSEFLNADYGVPVKQYLLDSGCLRAIIQFDFRTQVFAGILTTACIVLLERTPGNPPVRLTTVHQPEELPAAFAGLAGEAVPGNEYPWQSMPAAALMPARKWRNYFQAAKTSSTDGLLPLAQVARCMRGIATGCNAFFTLSEAEASAHGLGLASLKPCVTRARDARCLVFDTGQFAALKQAQRKAFLVDFGEATQPGEAAYLALGEHQGVHQRFLPRHRACWHAPERRPPADLWVQVFSRGRARFILNTAQALNLTCFHGLYLTDAGQPWRLLLWVYFNTPVGQMLMRQERREYGGGLEKFEPKDIERLPVPDFRRWPVAAIDELTHCAQALLAHHAETEAIRTILAQAECLIRSQLPDITA